MEDIESMKSLQRAFRIFPGCQCSIATGLLSPKIISHTPIEILDLIQNNYFCVNIHVACGEKEAFIAAGSQLRLPCFIQHPISIFQFDIALAIACSNNCYMNCGEGVLVKIQQSICIDVSINKRRSMFFDSMHFSS